MKWVLGLVTDPRNHFFAYPRIFLPLFANIVLIQYLRIQFLPYNCCFPIKPGLNEAPKQRAFARYPQTRFDVWKLSLIHI